MQNRRLWVRLNENGGKRHEMPCHHNLESYLLAYIEGCGLVVGPKGILFRTIGRGTRQLTKTPLPQANAYAMIRRRARAAGIATKIGNHSFHATGITAYLENGGTLEKGRRHGQPCLDAHHAALRPAARRDEPRRDRESGDLRRISAAVYHAGRRLAECACGGRPSRRPSPRGRKSQSLIINPLSTPGAARMNVISANRIWLRGAAVGYVVVMLCAAIFFVRSGGPSCEHAIYIMTASVACAHFFLLAAWRSNRERSIRRTHAMFSSGETFDVMGKTDIPGFWFCNVAIDVHLAFWAMTVLTPIFALAILANPGGFC